MRQALIERILEFRGDLTSISQEFGVSKEYVRQVAAKIGCDWYKLSSRSARIREHRAMQKALQDSRRKAKREKIAKAAPMLKIFRAMVYRCENPNHSAYRHYGGRGIRVCEEWKKDPQLFIQHMGDRPSKRHSVDRINNDGNYEPGNVRWATPTMQRENTRFNRLFEFNGKKRPLSEISRITGISKGKLKYQVLVKKTPLLLVVSKAA